VGEEAPIKRPPTLFGLLKAVKGVIWGQEQGLSLPLEQVMDGLDVQKHQIGQDKQEVPRAEALAFSDTGSGQMALDMQHGKQFLEPQLQASTEIFQRRFDLSLKTSALSVMQREDPFMWF
jgi:hypothetical protein